MMLPTDSVPNSFLRSAHLVGLLFMLLGHVGKSCWKFKAVCSVVRIRRVFQALVYLLSVFQHWTRAHGACWTVEEQQSQFDEQSASQETLVRKVSEEENMSVVREELHRQANYLCSQQQHRVLPGAARLW
jgi:hypothetical protein